MKVDGSDLTEVPITPGRRSRLATREHELKGVPDRWRLYRVVD